MQINVSVTDANNIVCNVVPPQTQVITIDRGVAGNGIVSIVPVTISTFQYLRITYTNGTVQDVGPLTSTAYTATAPITIVGNTISLSTVPIASGGTGATTAATAIQNLLPSYTGNANKRLGLNSGGTALEWVLDGGGTVTSVAASGGTTGLTFTGSPITTSGTLTLGGTLAVANGGTGVTTSTGTGSVVLSTSPTLVTPLLGTPTSGNFSTGTFTWPTFNQNTTGTAANITATSNSTLTTLSALSLPGSQVTGNISGNAANVTGTVAIANGGTGQITANAAFNALAPSQVGQSGKYLTTDGTNTSWATNPLGTVTSVAATVPSFLSVSGSPITTSGTLAFGLSGTALPTTSGGTGLTSYTANGVLYASSTSALTSGSALTFDGSALGVSSASNNQLALNAVSSTTGTRITISRNGTANTYFGDAYSVTGSNLDATALFTSGTNPLIFGIGSEQMRLTSTGLGIGTSSPSAKLTIAQSSNVITQGLLLVNAAGTQNGGWYHGGSALIGRENGTDTIALASGNVGIGTSSPGAKLDVSAANFSGGPLISARYNSSNDRMGFNIANSNGFPFLGYNVNNATSSDSGTFDRNGYASRLRLDNGKAVFESSNASGTAGNAITWNTNLTLDSSGNLGLGVTPSAWGSTFAGGVFQAKNASVMGYLNAVYLGANYYATNASDNYIATGFASRYQQTSGQHQWLTAPSGTAGNAITFTQALTLDASGNLQLGTTSNIGTSKVSIYSSDLATAYNGISVKNGTNSTGGYFAAFYNYLGNLAGSISQSSATTVLYNVSSDYRLKNITGPITTSGAYIDSLNPVEGTWKADGSTFVGLIAHEVQEASRTQVATGTKDGAEMQAMDYSNSELIANLIAEVKSLRQRVATLEAK